MIGLRGTAGQRPDGLDGRRDRFDPCELARVPAKFRKEPRRYVGRHRRLDAQQGPLRGLAGAGPLAP